jgi:hypothetical protein
MWKTIALTILAASIISSLSTAVAVALDPSYECNPNVKKLVLYSGSPAPVALFTGLYVSLAYASLRLASSGNRYASIFGKATLLSLLPPTLYMAVNDSHTLYMILAYNAPPPLQCQGIFLEVL